MLSDIDITQDVVDIHLDDIDVYRVNSIWTVLNAPESGLSCLAVHPSCIK